MVAQPLGRLRELGVTAQPGVHDRAVIRYEVDHEQVDEPAVDHDVEQQHRADVDDPGAETGTGRREDETVRLDRLGQGHGRMPRRPRARRWPPPGRWLCANRWLYANRWL